MIEKDNLIAVEMKKSDRPLNSKENDRNRLRALTKENYDDVWSSDGVTLPEYVCGYMLGVFIEIDIKNKKLNVEFFKKGELSKKETYDF